MDAAAAAKGYLADSCQIWCQGRIESELLTFQLRLVPQPEYWIARPPSDGEMRQAYSRLS